jgi:hypothetical protein
VAEQADAQDLKSVRAFFQVNEKSNKHSVVETKREVANYDGYEE